MKTTQSVVVLPLAAILAVSFAVARAANAAAPQRFDVQEYELFYVLLNDLQREALPQGDFQRIRSSASELVARGKAIVKIRLGKGRKSEEYSEARRKFDRALNAFKGDAKKNNDTRLSSSFTALHDAFAVLADEAPRVFWVHPPPIVSLSSCLDKNPKPEGELIVTAHATPNFDAEKRRFVWTISAGKIVGGQGTGKLAIDTTGLAGQKIWVKVGVIDGDGNTVYDSCEVQIAASKQP